SILAYGFGLNHRRERASARWLCNAPSQYFAGSVPSFITIFKSIEQLWGNHFYNSCWNQFGSDHQCIACLFDFESQKSAAQFDELFRLLYNAVQWRAGPLLYSDQQLVKPGRFALGGYRAWIVAALPCVLACKFLSNASHRFGGVSP